jgi:hypothetical protein
MVRPLYIEWHGRRQQRADAIGISCGCCLHVRDAVLDFAPQHYGKMGVAFAVAYRFLKWQLFSSQ